MSTIDDEIRARTSTFVTSLAAIIKRAALEAVETALGGRQASTAARGARSLAYPPTKALTSRKAVKGAAASRAPVARKGGAPKRSPGEKRPPNELAKLTERLGDYIKSNPGARMEAIAKALGTPTRDLNLPIKKLFAAKKIRSEGHKRATEYFPA